MKKLKFIGWVCGVLGLLLGNTFSFAADCSPNVIIIYVDDLGYGDLGCYGAEGVSTPNVDRLATEGLRFTDGHTTSATCTPSRYSLLTGRYAWRKPGTGVLPGDAAMIIEPGETTLATVFHQAGYRTGVVGKWHLGLGSGDVDWNGKVAPGPLEIGFDTCFLIPATGDRVPCVYVEDYGVVGLDKEDPISVSFAKRIGTHPLGAERPDLLKVLPSHGHDRTIINGVSRIGYMTGGHRARWVDEDMADVITRKAVDFIHDNAARHFFLYFSLHDIHVPRIPHPRFVGMTEMGPRGDAIAQVDWCTGEILNALDQLGLTEQTLIVFTSDNGPVIDDGYQDEAVTRLGQHRAAGPLRGGKYSNFEGGTRVPWIVRWPGRVKPGVSHALMSQVDFLGSFASLLQRPLDAEEGPDSQDQMAALLGEELLGRDHLVEHAGAISLRVGSYKFIPANGRAKINRSTNTELGNDSVDQLYDLANDLGETTNLAERYGERMREMKEQLEGIKASGRDR